MVWLIFGLKICGYFRMVTGMVMNLLFKPVILHRPSCHTIPNTKSEIVQD